MSRGSVVKIAGDAAHQRPAIQVHIGGDRATQLLVLIGRGGTANLGDAAI